MVGACGETLMFCGWVQEKGGAQAAPPLYSSGQNLLPGPLFQIPTGYCTRRPTREPGQKQLPRPINYIPNWHCLHNPAEQISGLLTRQPGQPAPAHHVPALVQIPFKNSDV